MKNLKNLFKFVCFSSAFTVKVVGEVSES